jgi:alcohol dehydrogenase
MFNNFEFSIPGRITFGAGALSQLGDKLKAANVKRALILSDHGLEKFGMVKKVEDVLASCDIAYEKFLDVEPNPSAETVMAAAKVYRDNNLETIICLGGGSPMDTGKAVAVMAVNPGTIEDYEGPDKFKGPLPAIVAIPTTAGTGSETTAFAVITDHKRNFKFSIISNELAPKIVILDPELITTVPPFIAASTGMDALTHALESYLSVTKSPFSDALNEKAMALIGKYIRRFVANSADIEAASGMMMASTFAGIAFSWARLGLAHAMAHPLGGYYNVAHGVANAIALPHVIEYNIIADTEGRYEKIYELIRNSTGYTDYFEPGMLVEEVKQLAQDIGIPAKLSDVGVDERFIPNMALDAYNSGSRIANPRVSTVKDIEDLYRKAL